jgi:hypothetical protein
LASTAGVVAVDVIVPRTMLADGLGVHRLRERFSRRANRSASTNNSSGTGIAVFVLGV